MSKSTLGQETGGGKIEGVSVVGRERDPGIDSTDAIDPPLSGVGPTTISLTFGNSPSP